MFKMFKRKKKSIPITPALRIAMHSWLEEEIRAQNLHTLTNDAYKQDAYTARLEANRRARKVALLLFHELRDVLPPGMVQSFERSSKKKLIV